ncbi:hypothetical protein [Intestinirhabdus alba]|jgi:hypothetical protein|uniref:Uncharacterized protein n=1 Tax=Intestinirhabdus alba TaxID=2899544 RepID=A0A6L6IMT2_9ENTR|nr:hypothetical protein [Intestinirhabdus alba]MTH46998.1 hypothetical protein [Intestinirhabdus alba]
MLTRLFQTVPLPVGLILRVACGDVNFPAGWVIQTRPESVDVVNETEIVIKPLVRHLKFLTLKQAKRGNFSRNGGKVREMRRLSHPSQRAFLQGSVNAITFTFALLPAANFTCQS